MARKPELPRGIVKERSTYRVRVTYKGQRHSVGNYDTLKSAKNALAVAKGEIATKTFIPPDQARAAVQAERAVEDRQRITLREWSEVWLEDLALNGRSPATVVSRRSVLRSHVWPVLGDVRLGDLTSDEITTFMGDLKVTPAVRRNVGLCLRACLNAAVKKKRITESPFTVAVVDSPESPGRALTAAQVQALTEAMPKHLALAVQLGAWCQLRLGETLGLQRHDFALEDAVPTVTVARQLNSKVSPPALTPPKGGSSRTVALPTAMVPAVRAHLRDHVEAEDVAPVFAGRSAKSGHLSQSAFDRAFRSAREAAKVGAVRYHDLRHTGLTLYARAGGTVADIMRRGGHKDVRVAMRYQHAALEREQALMDKMGIGGGDGA